MNRNLNGPQDVEKQLGVWFRSTCVTPLLVPLSESRHLSLRLINKAFVCSLKILQQLFARLNLQGQPALTSLLQTQHIFLNTHVQYMYSKTYHLTMTAPQFDFLFPRCCVRTKVYHQLHVQTLLAPELVSTFTPTALLTFSALWHRWTYHTEFSAGAYLHCDLQETELVNAVKHNRFLLN